MKHFANPDGNKVPVAIYVRKGEVKIPAIKWVDYSYVWGDYVVHENITDDPKDIGYFTVTHMPTGVAANHTYTQLELGDAIELAQRLDAVPGHFDTLPVPDELDHEYKEWWAERRNRSKAKR